MRLRKWQHLYMVKARNANDKSRINAPLKAKDSPNLNDFVLLYVVHSPFCSFRKISQIYFLRHKKGKALQR